jgi:hypothetical protein
VSTTWLSVALGAGVTLVTASCGGTLDAGTNAPHGLLPVDERNPVVLVNDSATDNWMGEYAVLLANNGGPRVAGIIVCSSNYWPDLNANVAGWTEFVNATRASGLETVAELTVSAGAPLTKPSNDQIDSTTPNHSTGAQRIIDLSTELSLPERPVVVLVGTQLTDLADAYLVDHSVVDRVVVVAALGSLQAPRALMTGPNGDLDPWGDWIVAHRFKYVQVSAFYDQTADVTSASLSTLPKNPLGDWIAAKQPMISTLPVAADQVTVLAAGLARFVTAVQRVSPDTSAKFGFPQGQGAPLVPDAGGNAWVVTKIAAPLAASSLWRMLLEPKTQGH